MTIFMNPKNGETLIDMCEEVLIIDSYDPIASIFELFMVNPLIVLMILYFSMKSDQR